MRKIISLILILILSANPAFAFNQAIPLAFSLPMSSAVGSNSITQQLNNAITRSIHGPGIDEPIAVGVIANPPKAGVAILISIALQPEKC